VHDLILFTIKIFSIYPPNHRVPLPPLLPNEPGIQRCTAFGGVEITIHGAFDAAGGYVDSLRWVLVEELATCFSFEKLDAEEHRNIAAFGYQVKRLLDELQSISEWQVGDYITIAMAGTL